MKKLLILLLVLCMASVSFALMDLEISVNGDLDPVDSEIILNPSDEAILNIHSVTTYDGTEDVYWALVVDTSAGTITGGTPTAGAPSDSAWYGNDAQMNGLAVAPEDGSWGYIGSIAGTSVGPGVYIDDILFHCIGPADAVINLYTTVDFGTFNLEDTVIIHQPEPMTIALLGLGGLFLRRRK